MKGLMVTRVVTGSRLNVVFCESPGLGYTDTLSIAIYYSNHTILCITSVSTTSSTLPPSFPTTVFVLFQYSVPLPSKADLSLLYVVKF